MLKSKNRSFLSKREIAITIIALLPMAIIKFNSIAGDSAVYFTYVKNFFNLPFSYHSGSVTFGASTIFYFYVANLFFFW